MGVAVKLLGQVQLGAAAADIYNPTGPAPFVAEAKSMWICNTDTANRAITIRIGTGALTAANSLFDGCTIPANDTWVIKDAEFLLAINSGYKIQGFADVAAKVTVTVFGEEIV
jgi:hypothetical protein